jgi:hypothetical protein
MSTYLVQFEGFSVVIEGATRETLHEKTLEHLEKIDGWNGVQFENDILNGETLPTSVEEV